MKPKISLLTLGVDDIQRSKKFYLALGFSIFGEDDSDIHVMFQMEGTYFSIFLKEKIAEEAGVEMTPRSTTDFVMARNVESKEAVDAGMKEAEAIGATITRPATDMLWGGYAGYFADPDGYLWSIAWNPFSDLT